MASGKPDWNRVVTMQATDGASWIPIKCDATGQLYIALSGQQIDVTQLDADRNILGNDGGTKRYVSVDSNGVILARLKGAYDSGLLDISVDSSGILLARLKGIYSGTLKDISVDADGQMIVVIKGDDDGTLRTLYVDSEGKLVTRIQGATGGDLVVYVLDDCGDTSDITDWVENDDALAPEITTTYVREGSKAMKLGIDASAAGTDVATWINQRSFGDFTGLTTYTIKMWVWISDLTYLAPVLPALYFTIGSFLNEYYQFHAYKDALVQGWNELSFDLSSPDATVGTVDWTAIDYIEFVVRSVDSNTHDYYVIVDSIVIVRLNEDPGVLTDLNTDENGFLLTKMVGSFGDYLKPIQVDRYGFLRCNITDQQRKPVLCNHNAASLRLIEGYETSSVAATKELFNLVGCGIINTFVLWLYASATRKDDRVNITIDGTLMLNMSLYDMNRFGLTDKNGSIPFLVLYDDSTFKYSVSMKPGIYFSESVLVEVIHVYAATATVFKANMTYSLL